MKITYLALTLVLVGCAHKKLIEITSDPVGANIDFDGAFLGKTPLKQEVTRPINEWTYVVFASEVKATLNGCTQVKQISKGQATPTQMFFDFKDCKVAATPLDQKLTELAEMEKKGLVSKEAADKERAELLKAWRTPASP